MDDEPGFPEPPRDGDEATTLLGSLERQRATFAWKCADLDAAGLTTTVGRSTVTLGGLLTHLAYLEDLNFTQELAGLELPTVWGALSPDADEWQAFPDLSPPERVRLWSDAVDRSRAAVAAALADGGPGHTFVLGNGRTVSLRRLLVDMIEEYGRHTGHADLIREAVDGRVGEDPPGRPYAYEMS